MIDYDKVIPLDRKIENKDVLAYQQTQCPKLLDVIVQRRLKTISTFVEIHHREWFPMPKEDFKQELMIPFMKAIDKFKPNNRDFNTVLYTYFLNYTRNIINKRFCKKRKAVGGEMSLDNEVEFDNQAGGQKNIVGSIMAKQCNTFDMYIVDDLIKHIIYECGLDDTEETREWLKGVAYGNHALTNWSNNRHRHLYQKFIKKLSNFGLTKQDLRKVIIA